LHVCFAIQHTTQAKKFNCFPKIVQRHKTSCNCIFQNKQSLFILGMYCISLNYVLRLFLTPVTLCIAFAKALLVCVKNDDRGTLLTLNISPVFVLPSNTRVYQCVAYFEVKGYCTYFSVD